MLFKFKMPDLSTNSDEIDVKQWLVGVGEKITRGQAILEIETDKAVMEVESPVEGVLQEWVAQPDTTVGVGTVIAHIKTERR
jgi:pyruvate dehydrogenase E2 component (dihydrolipoamide acetyltransferase)